MRFLLLLAIACFHINANAESLPSISDAQVGGHCPAKHRQMCHPSTQPACVFDDKTYSAGSVLRMAEHSYRCEVDGSRAIWTLLPQTPVVFK